MIRTHIGRSGRDRKENKKNHNGDDLHKAHMCCTHVVAVLFIKRRILYVGSVECLEMRNAC